MSVLLIAAVTVFAIDAVINRSLIGLGLALFAASFLF